MPKLIIKQDIDPARLQAQRNKQLSIIGLLLLLAVVTAAAFLLTRPVINALVQSPLILDSATSMEAKNNYISLHNVFNELGAEYETLSAQGSDDYEKNLKLLDQSGAILHHLEKMQQAVPEIGLDDDEQKQLYNRQQFYKDYWQAKSHFRRLRVSHFKNGTNNSETVLPEWQGQTEAAMVDNTAGTETVPTVADAPKKFRFATPPPGMKLPTGFCDLNNPGSCKPGENQAGDTTEPTIPLAEDIPVSDKLLPVSDPDNPPRKFKFATPPAGMELPTGFCDLTNPGSCKPDTF
ncbi:MAG: hypothetical protein CSA79_01225 [Thiothrix nivea]|nr:MAG: hypothetical protein CSA79_01225 [Thiothrix nivea]